MVLGAEDSGVGLKPIYIRQIGKDGTSSYVVCAAKQIYTEQQSKIDGKKLSKWFYLNLYDTPCKVCDQKFKACKTSIGWYSFKI